jgi:hypothetical protein
MGAAKLKKVTTAWHEAGHIVVGMHFGFTLTQATITPRHTNEGTFCGGTEWAAIGGTFDATPLICMALAGGMAEEKWRGTSGGWHGDGFANISALAWLHLARTTNFVPHASLLIRLTAAYRRQPHRVLAKVRALVGEMVVKATPETKRILNHHWTKSSILPVYYSNIPLSLQSY